MEMMVKLLLLTIFLCERVHHEASLSVYLYMIPLLKTYLHTSNQIRAFSISHWTKIIPS